MNLRGGPINLVGGPPCKIDGFLVDVINDKCKKQNVIHILKLDKIMPECIIVQRAGVHFQIFR